MWRPAVLVGRSLADLLTAAICAAFVAVTGLVVGWRPDGDIGSTIAGFAIFLFFSYALSWGCACLGMVSKSPESAQGIGSSSSSRSRSSPTPSFRPQHMPAVLRTIANWNPVSAVTAAARELWGNPNPSATIHAWPMQHPCSPRCCGRSRSSRSSRRWPPASTGAAPPTEHTTSPNARSKRPPFARNATVAWRTGGSALEGWVMSSSLMRWSERRRAEGQNGSPAADLRCACELSAWDCSLKRPSACGGERVNELGVRVRLGAQDGEMPAGHQVELGAGDEAGELAAVGDRHDAVAPAV